MKFQSEARRSESTSSISSSDSDSSTSENIAPSPKRVNKRTHRRTSSNSNNDQQENRALSDNQHLPGTGKPGPDKRNRKHGAITNEPLSEKRSKSCYEQRSINSTPTTNLASKISFLRRVSKRNLLNTKLIFNFWKSDDRKVKKKKNSQRKSTICCLLQRVHRKHITWSSLLSRISKTRNPQRRTRKTKRRPLGTTREAQQR